MIKYFLFCLTPRRGAPRSWACDALWLPCFGDAVRLPCFGDAVRLLCFGDAVRLLCFGDDVRLLCVDDFVQFGIVLHCLFLAWRRHCVV